MPVNRPSDSDISWLPWYEQLKMRRRLQSRYSEPDPARRASTLKSLLEFAPVTGEASAARDALSANKRAATSLQEGDFWGALSNYGDMALAGLGAIPLMGMAGRATRKGIKAYHGSPHDFDQFQMDRIGTGEGAQAYGHGMYLAESEDVAKQYRDKLTLGKTRTIRLDGNEVDPYHGKGGIESRALRAMEANDGDIDAAMESLDRLHLPEAKEWLRGNAHRIEVGPSPGRLYEVEIDADPEDFLDWDKPLSEQSEKVRQKIEDMRARLQEKMASDAHVFHNPTPEEIDSYRAQADEIINNMTGQELYRALDEFGGRAWPLNDPKVSGKFSEAGIPGIKYLDQGSRTAGEGTRNYVVFDDKLINIVKKYGIAGALGAGLITADQAQALQAEGYE